MMTSSKQRKFTFNCLLKDINEVSVAYLKSVTILLVNFSANNEVSDKTVRSIELTLIN